MHVETFNNLTTEQRKYFTGGYIETSISLKRDEDSNSFKPTMHRKFKTTGATNRPYLMALNLFLEEAHDMVPENSVLHVVLDRNTPLEANVADYFGRSWVPLFHPGETRFATIEFQDSICDPAL